LFLAIASVRYKSAAPAALAWQRLQDFEYPPGFLIRVRYGDAGFPEEWSIELYFFCTKIWCSIVGLFKLQ